MSVSIVWFRRDLRLHDHPALSRAIADGDRVAPLFVLDDTLVGGRWHSPNRLWFLRASVAELDGALLARGAPMTVLRGRPADLVPAFAAAVGARRVIVSRDHAPYGRARDAGVAALLGGAGVAWDEAPGVLVHEPEAVTTRAGGPFRVFAPFLRAWLAEERRVVLAAPDRIPGVRGRARRDERGGGSGSRIKGLLPPVTPTADPALLPVPGELAARARLVSWASSAALGRYADDRDRLDLDGTSRLGADLRFGLLSAAEVAARCDGPGEGRDRFLSELAWRDFYAHLRWHEPRLARESFDRRLDDAPWQQDRALVAAWRDGRTGYPVVDAAMRQLRATGWMPNRARMIVASFLTRHLGVPWRVGERHFMEHLVDGDPASNNGGWQWAAATGADAPPWFRVLNPTLQGLRHDPDGAYVRRWVPELAELPGAAAHEPPPGRYLSPVVDHGLARARTLAAYRAALGR